MLPQHIGCERMEGAQVSPLGVCSQQVIHPLPHFGRSLVRERKGQRGSVLILFNQVGYPQREHAGLSGAWTRKNQKRPILPLHSPPLVLVEVLEGEILLQFRLVLYAILVVVPYKVPRDAERIRYTPRDCAEP